MEGSTEQIDESGPNLAGLAVALVILVVIFVISIVVIVAVLIFKKKNGKENFLSNPLYGEGKFKY